MKAWEFFMLLSAIYLAPNLRREGRDFMATMYIAAAAVCVGIEAYVAYRQ